MRMQFIRHSWFHAACWFALLGLFPNLTPSARGGLQLGVGAHYWRAIDSVDTSRFDQSGIIWLLSARYQPVPILGLGLEVEQFPKGFAGASETLYAPAFYLLLGKPLYAGLGAGLYMTDGGNYSSSLFYVLRGGLMFSLLPLTVIDLHLNYRVDTWDAVSTAAREVDTDTLTLGGALRIAF